VVIKREKREIVKDGNRDGGSDVLLFCAVTLITGSEWATWGGGKVEMSMLEMNPWWLKHSLKDNSLLENQENRSWGKTSY